MLNFWATWCAAVRGRDAAARPLYRTVHEQGRHDRRHRHQELRRAAWPRPSSRTTTSATRSSTTSRARSILALGSIPSSLPFSVLIDKQGRVAAVYLGVLTPKDLTPALNQLRAETLMLAQSGFTHAVTDGPLLVAAGVAALVGLVGFLSPCVLPLVPGYLSYVAGLSGADAKPAPRRMVSGALLFVLGFTAVFVCEGLLFGELGSTIREHPLTIERVLGVITILMGIVFLGGIPFLQREFRVHNTPRAGLIGAPLLGIVFGLAWAPCLTPTLTRGERPRVHAGIGGARRVPSGLLLHRAGRAVRPGGAGLRLGVGRARVHPPAPPRGEPDRRRAARSRSACCSSRARGTTG